jgi:hypothetical protein
MPDWFDQHTDILGPNASAGGAYNANANFNTAGRTPPPATGGPMDFAGPGPMVNSMGGGGMQQPAVQPQNFEQGATPSGGTAQGTPAAGGGGAPFQFNQQNVSAILNQYPHTPAGLQQAFAQHPELAASGSSIGGSKGSKIVDPSTGKLVQVVQSAGLGGTAWTWDTGEGGAGAAGAAAMGPVAGMGDLGFSSLGATGAQAALPRDLGSVSAKELTASQDYKPTDVAGPEKPVVGTINQPGAVTADQVTGQTSAAPAKVTADQVTGPQALTAKDVADPSGFQNLTADQLQQDPSYKFRLSQGLGALQNSAAARGFLNTGATAKGLMDYAGQSASQEYQAANERARQTYQQNLTNQASVTGQNNAAQAQAYGLTNQFQQAAQLANQGANLNAAQFNVNAGQQNQQFNASNAQQAALANQGANLQAGQFNAGMNFNTQAQNAQNQLAAYNAYQPLQQQNAQFNAGQQASAAQQNFANRFNVEQANNANNLGAFNANTNAALGLGQLNLGAAQAANSYNLGLGNLSLGNKQADQSYNLGLGNLGVSQGNLGVSQGYLGLAGQNQGFNQGLQTFNTNYGVYRDNRDTAFNQQLQLGQLGQNSALNYGNSAAGLYSGQGNANAAAGMAGANAYAGALGTIGNTAQQAGYYNAMYPQQRPPNIPYNTGLPQGLPGSTAAPQAPVYPSYSGVPTNPYGYGNG